MNLNIRDAYNFVSGWFEKTQITVQVFPESKEAIRKAIEAEWNGAWFSGDLDNLWPKIERFNSKGCNVSIAVNDCDGAGRKMENITGVRGFFLDLDGAPLSKVKGYAKVAKTDPTYIIESSPGRYHVYWKTDFCPKAIFPGIQSTLAKKFSGDTSSAYVNKCMRLPGTFNVKKGAFMSKIIYSSDSVIPYSRARRIWKPEIPKKEKTIPTEIKWDKVVYGACEGERNIKLFKFTCRMRSCNIDLAEAERQALLFADCCNPPLPHREALYVVRNVWRRYPAGGTYGKSNSFR